MGKGGLPGHMARAQRKAQQLGPLVDVILEVLDARAPLATGSPAAASLAARRPAFTVMTHADLAEPVTTGAWLRHYAARGRPAFAVDAITGEGIPKLRRGLSELHSGLAAGWQQRGLRERPLRAMVVGVPNVGKSSLLNRLARRALARTGAKPGITRGEQWLRGGEGLELLDLPGMLPARAGDADARRMLTVIGVLTPAKEEALELAGWFLSEGRPALAAAIAGRAGAAYQPGQTIEFIRELGRRRGRLLPGGEVDLEATALGFIRELASGQLGRCSLEAPPQEGGP
ncbi:MAG TPA: ribosome biogenesis GTPase YlqF [Clostridiales bacterium UBA8153]|nr:ribosome biogenesis GTPase YlqF [Clostridiales bacterium UBA8153]